MAETVTRIDNKAHECGGEGRRAKKTTEKKSFSLQYSLWVRARQRCVWNKFPSFLFFFSGFSCVLIASEWETIRMFMLNNARWHCRHCQNGKLWKEENRLFSLDQSSVYYGFLTSPFGVIFCLRSSSPLVLVTHTINNWFFSSHENIPTTLTPACRSALHFNIHMIVYCGKCKMALC